MRNTYRFLPLAAAAAIAAILVACNGGSGSPSGSPTPKTTVSAAGEASPSATSSRAFAGRLCGLLPKSEVERITGTRVLDAKELSPEPHACEVRLDVASCGSCALSLEEMGSLNDKTEQGIDTEAYRHTLTHSGDNPQLQFAFEEKPVGDDSWLATATAGNSPGFKVLYFDVGDIAFNLTSARARGDLLSAEQMTALARLVVDNAHG